MEEVPILEEKGETIEIINFDPIKIEQNEIIYILNMEAKEDKITFSINDKEQLPSVNYIRTMTLKEIKELNNVFNVLSSFNEFYDYLKSLSNNHKLNIKKDNNKITIIFYVEVLLKHQKIEINLNKAKNDINLNIKEIYQELFNIKNKIKEIDTLKNENNNLKIKIEEISNEMDIIKNENIKLNNEIDTLKVNNNKLNNELYNLKTENNEIKSKIEEHNKEINEIKEKNNNSINNNKDNDNIISGLKNSLIINNNIEYNKLIKSWINPNKKIEGELLYRLSRDGDSISKFHELCDNKGPTLTLFETTDGNKGGIYTPLSWDNKSCSKNDLETFMFNLNKNKKYKKIKKDNSIYCVSYYGPWTKLFGFHIDKQMRKIFHGGTDINSYYENGAECLPNNSETRKWFETKEVEIYQIKLWN